jgi:hypothetical protein
LPKTLPPPTTASALLPLALCLLSLPPHCRHWFAYNGDTPTFIKSYYNKAGGSQRQDPQWFDKVLYTEMVKRGYNHHMASGFMPVLPLTALWDGAPFSDGPKAINHTIYTDPTSPHTSMSLDVYGPRYFERFVLRNLCCSIMLNIGSHSCFGLKPANVRSNGMALSRYLLTNFVMDSATNTEGGKVLKAIYPS